VPTSASLVGGDRQLATSRPKTAAPRCVQAPENAGDTYEEEHIITYLRLLDADAEGADWREVVQIVLHIDPEREPARGRHAFDSHLARAKWMTEHGYRHICCAVACRA
jgi:hypothetical protein